MLAPMMTPIACDSFISPELTKPIIMTVVAADDCITAVLRVCIPKRNRAIPPSRFSMS